MKTPLIPVSPSSVRYPYRVYRTAFHGGGLLSRHATAPAAEKAARKARIGDCCCGCAVVVGPDQPEPESAGVGHDPYRAAS